jgi:SAM-dependent methyltransferase
MSAEALRAALEGAPSPPVALMRLMLSGMPASEVAARLREAGDPALEPLRRLAEAAGDGLLLLQRMVEAGAEHGPGGVEVAREMFDRLVRISPEGSVAAYSLGDPRLLGEATAEVLAWLRGLGLLAGRPAVLDLGCGIGRFCLALAEDAACVLGLDVSPGMVEVARERCAAHPAIRIAQAGGRDLAGVPDASFDMVLAVDVFPYLVQAGVAEAHLREAARVLRPGGQLAVLNFSYQGAETDRREVPALAARAGLEVLECGTAPFRLWDGLAFRMRRGQA